MKEISTKCLIIGSGPAGYTAGIYTSRANLNPVMIEGQQPGGQLVTTTEIENFPGFSGIITGPELMEKMREQALKFGLQIISGMATEVDFKERPFTVKVGSDTVVKAETVIISTGASARYLGLDDERKYLGMGVSACATCDGFFFRKRTVAIVGGGDTACEEALYLAGLASKVYMIVRRDQLRASKYMQRKVFEHPNIEILYNTQTEGLYGEEVLEGAHLVTNRGTDAEKHYDLPIDGFFLAIGHTPNTEIFKGQVELDEAGYIKTHSHRTETNVMGVFAAGDVADPFYQQAISAAGMGCRAAIDAEHFILMHE